MTRLTRLRSLAFMPAVRTAGQPFVARGRAAAKRAVLSGLVAVIVLNLGMNVALDTVAPEWRDPEYGHRMKGLRRQAAAESSRPVVVLLGSSRTEMGMSPASLGLGDGPASPLTYNVSQAGCGPVGEVLNLKRLLADGVKPHAALFEILPPVLGGNAPAERLLLPTQLASADIDHVGPYLADRDAFRGKWLRTRINPWYTYRNHLLCHWGARSLVPKELQTDFLWTQLRPGGWLPYTFDEVEPDRRAAGTARAQAEYAGYFPNFRIADVPERAYRDLIALCRDRGIRVGFYTMPESATFRSWYPPEARAEVAAYFSRLRRDQGVVVFDCSDWMPDEKNFADGHHLLGFAAAAFSERFGRECVGPWLRDGPP